MEQHLKALEQANKRRLAKTQIKREVKSGNIDIKNLILAPPKEIENTKIYELLIAQRQWGNYRAVYVLNKAQCSVHSKFKSITGRQRYMLVEAIDNLGKPKIHNTCPGCGNNKHVDSQLCRICENKRRADI